MPALSFQAEFADAVERGEKRQTIRRKRRRPIRVGDRLHLYTGMRTKACRKLGEAVCTQVHQITIGRDKRVWLDGKRLSWYRIALLAYADGFSITNSFFYFFRDRYELPFRGVLIKWNLEGKHG